MCLYSWKSRKKAKEDIICYKVFAINKDGNLTSRYYDYKWVVGQLNKAEKAKYSHFSDKDIASGYFHSYEYFGDALSSIPSTEIKDIVYSIYKCIIPKGSYYYQGIHSDGRDGYASKELIVVECV